MDTNQFEIHSNSVRYVDPEGTVLAEVTFPKLDGNIVDINHTFVDPSLRGQGIAGKLLENVAQELEETGRRAHPTCSYAVTWFEKHPERASLLASYTCPKRGQTGASRPRPQRGHFVSIGDGGKRRHFY